MSILGEVPFRRYYGSIDATPLFVILGRRVLQADGRPRFRGIDLVEVQRALKWIDRYGDADGDGFVELQP